MTAICVTEVIYDARARAFIGQIRFSDTDLSPALRVPADGRSNWNHARIVDAIITEGARTVKQEGWA